MTDASVLLCSAEDKPQIEARNAITQLEYIEDVVARELPTLSVMHLRDLQSIAIEDIYPCGGRYRNARDQIRVGFFAPHESLVEHLVRDMVDWTNAARSEGVHGIVAAAYVMWRVNWIHPFSGGNGRSARAIAYLTLALYGRILPFGRPMPAIIEEHHDEYIRALRAVDSSVLVGTYTDELGAEQPIFDETRLDLFPMVDFVSRMLKLQLRESMAEERLERFRRSVNMPDLDADWLVDFLHLYLFDPKVADLSVQLAREKPGSG